MGYPEKVMKKLKTRIEYGICGSPVEVDAELGEFHWENPDGTVRFITKGDPSEAGTRVMCLTATWPQDITFARTRLLIPASHSILFP